MQVGLAKEFVQLLRVQVDCANFRHGYVLQDAASEVLTDHDLGGCVAGRYIEVHVVWLHLAVVVVVNQLAKDAEVNIVCSDMRRTDVSVVESESRISVLTREGAWESNLSAIVV